MVAVAVARITPLVVVTLPLIMTPYGATAGSDRPNGAGVLCDHEGYRVERR